jgi:hypothetical protein
MSPLRSLVDGLNLACECICPYTQQTLLDGDFAASHPCALVTGWHAASILTDQHELCTGMLGDCSEVRYKMPTLTGAQLHFDLAMWFKSAVEANTSKMLNIKISFETDTF